MPGLIGPLTPGARAAAALGKRVAAAFIQFMIPRPVLVNNGDEDLYPNKLASYSKGLTHDSVGIVDPAAYGLLIAALSIGTPGAIEAIPRGGPRKQVNPLDAYHFALEGTDPHALYTPPAPTFTSAEQASEMGELYWQALARDVRFADYGTDPITQAAVNDLNNNFSDFRGPKPVTPQNLFRGQAPGVDIGPYVSQFLLRNIPSTGPLNCPCPSTPGVPWGVQFIDQRNIVPVGLDEQPANVVAPKVNDFMTTFAEWLAVQKGAQPPPRQTTYEPDRRYLLTGRDLAEFVHLDFPYQEALNAANILINAPTGLAFECDEKYSPNAYDLANPYLSLNAQAGFATFGNADIQVQLAKVAQYALDHAWFHKWLLHRRLRPEEYGGRVEAFYTKGQPFPISLELQNSDVIQLIRQPPPDGMGSTLLSQAFPEGSPTHPSYPQGHGTFIGAEVTMLKAFFKEDYVIPNPVEPDHAGTGLQSYPGSLTVGGELNKLAFNIAIARDFAGVHYRSDAWQGLLLGEQVAIRLLQDLIPLYQERLGGPFGGFLLTKFDGTTIVIH